MGGICQAKSYKLQVGLSTRTFGSRQGPVPSILPVSLSPSSMPPQTPLALLMPSRGSRQTLLTSNFARRGARYHSCQVPPIFPSKILRYHLCGAGRVFKIPGGSALGHWTVAVYYLFVLASLFLPVPLRSLNLAACLPVSLQVSH